MSNNVLSICISLVAIITSVLAQDSSPSSLYPNLTPNAFTNASWSIPELQNLLLESLPGIKAAEIHFYAVDDALSQKNNPYHATIANIVSQNIAGIDSFTVALYLQVKGEAMAKFLKSEGFIIEPTLPQEYASYLQDAVKDSGATSFEDLIRPLLDGYINFFLALGFDFDRKIYNLSVLFGQEELNVQRFNPKSTPEN